MIALTIGDLYDRCVQFHGRSTAITHGDRSYTYSQMGENANRLVNAFKGLGLGKGDRVAFLMANCPEYIFSEYAVAKTGCVRVPLAVLLGQEDHIYMVNQSRCTALIYHETMADRIREMRPRLETVRHYICVVEEGAAIMPGHLHLQTLMKEHAPRAEGSAVDPEDLVGIYYTGGTTGRPKGVMLSHRAWVNTILFETLEFGFGRREGWLYTGDIARQDDEGYLYIVDRKKDMIISGGFNIYPREIEDVLFEHPAVKDAAVIGVPHDKWGEEVKALVVLKPGVYARDRDIMAFVKERKGSLVAPKSVDFVEALPKTASGKIMKSSLKKRFWK